jgi:hypothetical protein
MITMKKTVLAALVFAGMAAATDYDNRKVLTLSPSGETQIRFQVVGDATNWWIVDAGKAPGTENLNRIWDMLQTSLVKGCAIWFSTDGTLNVVSLALRNVCAYH